MISPPFCEVKEDMVLLVLPGLGNYSYIEANFVLFVVFITRIPGTTWTTSATVVHSYWLFFVLLSGNLNLLVLVWLYRTTWQIFELTSLLASCLPGTSTCYR